MSDRTKNDELRRKILETLRRRNDLAHTIDERTDISKESSDIEDKELEETEYTESAVIPSLHTIGTPVSILDKEVASLLTREAKIWHISTPSTSELDEIKRYREDIIHLQQQNRVLSRTNDTLTNELAELTHKYAKLEEEAISEMKKLREEITKLREEIKYNNEIRTLTFSVPESWLEEEGNEEE